VGPRAGLDRCGKSRPTGIRSPDRPARNQSLYRLSYPAHSWFVLVIKYGWENKMGEACGMKCEREANCKTNFGGEN
jgi:hypothetical protein